MEKSTSNEIDDLKQELKKTRQVIKDLKKESLDLKRAIWDILNYSNMYILLLDNNMLIKLINWSLATELGFKHEKEAIGKNWSDFVPENSRDLFEIIHRCLSCENPDKYREVTTEIKRLDNSTFVVKWFNIPTNRRYNMTFSMGLKISVHESNIVSEDSIRSYYRDIIANDRTMIQSLKDVVAGFRSSTCKK